MEKQISVLKLAKFIRAMMRDVKNGNMFLTLDIKDGRLFLRKAEFHG